MAQNHHFNKLKESIEREVAFVTSNYADHFISRRIECRLRALNLELTDYFKYEQILNGDSGEQKKLLKELTIHVTHFFRDKSLWDTLSNKLIPDLINQKKSVNSNRIRIWSAGSSTGEEACTILMCFHEALGSKFYDYDIRIEAHDFDHPTVEFARQGIYDELQFKETDSQIKNKYFDLLEDGRYKVKSLISKHISFNQSDILSVNRPRNMDLVFCRNTVIYFTPPTKIKLYEEIHKSVLNNNGYFVMGKTETLLGESRELFEVYDSAERIYHKRN